MVMHMVLAVASAAAWAGSFVATKMLSVGLLAPLFAFVRFGIGALGLLPFVKERDYKKISRRDMAMFAVMGASMCMVFALIFNVLHAAPVSTVSLILAIHPIALALVGLALARKVPSKYQFVAGMLAFAGFAVMVAGKHFEGKLLSMEAAEMLALAIVACQIIYVMAMRKVTASLSPQVVMLMMCVWGMLFALPFLAHQEIFNVLRALPMMQWGLMAFVGVVGTALSFPLYSMVIDRMGGAKATMVVGSLVPVIAGLGAYFLLGEMVCVEQLAGGIFIIGALVVNGLCG